jgi:hypothetical protein
MRVACSARGGERLTDSGGLLAPAARAPRAVEHDDVAHAIVVGLAIAHHDEAAAGRPLHDHEAVEGVDVDDAGGEASGGQWPGGGDRTPGEDRDPEDGADGA